MKTSVRLHISDGERKWTEEYTYEVSPEEIMQWGRDIVKFFNNTLEPYEKPRTLMDAELVCVASTDPKLLYCPECGRKAVYWNNYYEQWICCWCEIKFLELPRKLSRVDALRRELNLVHFIDVLG